MASLQSLMMEQLCKNSSEMTKIRLALDENSDVPALLNALFTNTTVQEVNVDIYDNFRHRSDSTAEILQLFAALSSLPNLYRLWLDSGREGSPFYTLPVQALALVLQQAPQMTRLALYDVELFGGLAEFQQLELALEQHTKLHDFGLVGCRLADETIQSTCTTTSTTYAGDCTILSNVIGKSLATLPSLEWVELSGQEFDALGTLSPGSLGSLCESSSLTKLMLDNFELSDPHIVAMSSVLAESTTIQEIKWTFEIGVSGCTALSHMLNINSSLENVTLHLNDVLTDNNNKKEDPTLLIAQGLEQNQSIEYFTLFGPAKISSTTQEAFVALLRQNTSLVHCSIDLEHCGRLSDKLQAESELYLKLNEVGRKQLFDSAPPQQWIDTLWKLRHNLDGLYYLISVNPTLCSLAGTINCSKCEMFDTLIKYGNREQKIRLS
jgi:hypothetical protein